MNDKILLQIEHRLTAMEVQLSELQRSLDRVRTFGWGAIASLVASAIGWFVR